MFANVSKLFLFILAVASLNLSMADQFDGNFSSLKDGQPVIIQFDEKVYAVSVETAQRISSGKLGLESLREEKPIKLATITSKDQFDANTSTESCFYCYAGCGYF